MTLVYVTLAWLAGTLLARYIDLPPALYLALSLGGLGGVLYYWEDAGKRTIALLLIGLALAGFRYQQVENAIGNAPLTEYHDHRVTVRGYVCREPSLRSQYTQLEIRTQGIQIDEAWQAVEGKLVVNVSRYPAYQYGDRLIASGEVETPPIIEGFSYQEYLAGQGVSSLMRRAEIEKLPQQQPRTAFLRTLYRWKDKLREHVQSILPDPEAGLLAGILLGLDHTLPQELQDAYRASGLTHIIVISGFNISLVAQAVMLAWQERAHRYLVLSISLIAILFYTVFVGPSPPVLRAAIMGSLTILAQLLGRKSHALTALALSVLAMICWNPHLLWSVSLQLSVASTLGLILATPVIMPKMDQLLAVSGRDDIGKNLLSAPLSVLITTLIAQLATLPIIWLSFGEISLVSLFTNLLALAPQPLITILGWITVVAACLSETLGGILAWPVWLLLRYTNLIVESAAAVPWASIAVPSLPPLFIWSLYGLVTLQLKPRPKRPSDSESQRTSSGPKPPWHLLAAGAAVILVWIAVISLPDGRLHLYALDVGQGDALLIRSPTGRTILVDGGPDPVVLSSRLGRRLPFWQRHVDLVVATHADADHLTGLLPVVQHYQVVQVLQPADMGESILAQEWAKTLEEAGLDPLAAQTGMTIQVDRYLHLEILNPPEATESEALDQNQRSVVLRCVMGEFSFLLTADIDHEVEQRMLRRQAPLRATLLKVGHHGAATSSGEAFVEAVNPQLALISVGKDNSFGHPDPEVVDRLFKAGSLVYRTDQQGTIQIISDGSRLWIDSYSTFYRK